jgi:hypothetical protein
MYTGISQRCILAACGLAAVAALLLSAGNAAAAECANEKRRSELGFTQLPDCRGYELVSPAAKNGWLVGVVSADSSRVVLKSLGAFAGSNQSAAQNLYMAERTAGGWSTLPFVEPAGFLDPQLEPLLAGSADLNLGLFELAASSTATPHEKVLYRDALPAGPPQEVGPVFSHAAVMDNPANVSAPLTSTPSASEHLTTIVFAIEGPKILAPPGYDYLWPGDTTVENTGPLDGSQGFASLYEYRGIGNSAPALVGVNNEGHLISQCGVSVGYPSEGNFHRVYAEETYNAISADGSRIFFTVAGATQGPSGNACTGEGSGVGPTADELFARVFNPATEKRETVAISEPGEEDCKACNVSHPANALFAGASKDGSKVFFLSEQELLTGASGESLYEYNFNAENEGKESGSRLTLVAPDVAGVARVSEDGSHIYFVSREKLTDASNPFGDTAQREGYNLYIYAHDKIAFIGALSSEDSEDWQLLDDRPVDATPDGQYVVFTSTADLTHENTHGATQVFEYSAQSGSLVRVSTGTGGPDEYGSTIVRQEYSGSQNPEPQLSSISEDGSYVVFQSDDALVPQATLGYTNVYEYHNGQVSLISDGQDHTGEMGRFGIDGSGEDIFFTSADQLVPQDGDTQIDLYDARINGGFPAPPATAECKDEGCQGALAPAPLLPSVGSVSQAPGENVVEPQSAATKTKRAGRKKAVTSRSKGRAKVKRKRKTPRARGIRK